MISDIKECSPLRIVIVTAHFFAPEYRRAGMHQFAVGLARKGHRVDFITVSQGRMKQRISKQTRHYAHAVKQSVAEQRNPDNIHSHVHDEFCHPISSRHALPRFASKPLLASYGKYLDPYFEAVAAMADIIILECGYPLFFREVIARLNPRAKLIAFFNDRLDLVGFRPEVVGLLQRTAGQYDMVRTNAERLLDYLPLDARGVYIPQGIDRAQLDQPIPTPYPKGTRNIVSVGNMLFDEVAVRHIGDAAAALEATVHVIGAQLSNPPTNIIVHGELPFARTLPFIAHADVGLAPYRPALGMDYLAQSSLKLQQYSYCGLPILLPRELVFEKPNAVPYERSDRQDIVRAVTVALAMPKMPKLREHIPDWDEVCDMLLGTIMNPARSERQRMSYEAV